MKLQVSPGTPRTDYQRLLTGQYMSSGIVAGRRNGADKYQVFGFRHTAEAWKDVAFSAMYQIGGNK